MHALIDQGARERLSSTTMPVTACGLPVKAERPQDRLFIPALSRSGCVQNLYRAGKIELETVPQGTLAERIRIAVQALADSTRQHSDAACRGQRGVSSTAGSGVSMPTMHSSAQADRWGTHLLPAELCADGYGGQLHRGGEHVVELGEFEAESVDTPGIFVDRVVHVPEPLDEDAMYAADKAT